MLGFSPYSAAAFSDVGSGEQLFVATGVVSTGAVGTVSVTGNQSGLTELEKSWLKSTSLRLTQIKFLVKL